jgi:hypothetical protein
MSKKKRDLTDAELQTIEELREKHGEVKYYLVRDTLCVVRRAKRHDLERYQDTIAKSMTPRRRGQDGPTAADASRTLGISSWVWPEDKETRARIMDEQPGFIGRAASDAEVMAEDEIEDFEGN